MKEIQIAKEAENSNDLVLKQKATNMKAEIFCEEQAKLQRQIERNTLETIILTGLGVIFIGFAYLGFRLMFNL
ncbi:hypothetical protein NX88_11310 [Neisseria meningitidis]|nr:hypothetical protein NX88_11310 [Neisseria meningitidis]